MNPNPTVVYQGKLSLKEASVATMSGEATMTPGSRRALRSYASSFPNMVTFPDPTGTIIQRRSKLAGVGWARRWELESARRVQLYVMN